MFLSMAKAQFLETTTATLQDLFSNGKLYRVPLYQRDYMWGPEQWEMLWEDVLVCKDSDSPHYLGALVLQRISNDPIQVIDGQQRLATLVIACMALLEILKHKSEDIRFGRLRSEYVGDLDPGNLKWNSKLVLNETDDAFFQQFIVNLAVPPAPTRLRGSHKRLWNALRFFKTKWAELLPQESTGEEVVDAFRKTIGTRFLFTTITVDDELDAYAVFETLNSRSLQLTSSDLLKNYLFSLLKGGETDLTHARHQWRQIVGTVEAETVPSFLRQFWISKRKLVRADRLFRALKNEIKSREQAFLLLEELESSAQWFRALGDANDEIWNDSKEARHSIRVLNLMGVSQHYPLLLCCFSKGFDLKRVATMLHACIVLFFRHTVVGQRNPSDLELRFNQIAIALSEGKVTSPQSIWKGPDGRHGLRDFYISDEDFQSDFARFELPTTGRKARLPRYVLFEIDQKMQGPGGDFEVSNATLEHILPENPNHGWTQFSEEDRRRFVSWIGNYALLDGDRNRRLGNKSFEQKKQAYLKSPWPSTRAAADFDEWTPQAIRERQEKFAKLAVEIWRCEF
jgi:hypothetical protein